MLLEAATSSKSASSASTTHASGALHLAQRAVPVAAAGTLFLAPQEVHVVTVGCVIFLLVSGGHCNAAASFSDGVMNPRVLRGLLLRRAAMTSRSAWVKPFIDLPFGKY